MDNKTVFVITLKGEGEIKNHTRHLSDDVKRVLALVDDESTVELLMRRAAPSLRAELSDILQKLENGGFIQNNANARTGNMLRMATPKTPVPAKNAEEGDDLDFTNGMSALPPPNQTRELAKTEVAQLKGGQEAAAIRVQLEAVQAKAEADAKAHAEAEARAKQEAEMVRLKVEEKAAQVRAEAEAARIKAAQDAAKAKAELEAARLEAERVRAELEAARKEAEALAKREAEAARLRAEEAVAKARAEAEAVRLKAEQEAARVKAELVAAQAKAAAEAQARVEAEERAKLEADAARRRAEQEAAKARAEAEAKNRHEAEAARVKAELETAQARAKAEARAKQEEDAARLKAEQAAAKARIEAEAKARDEAETARLNAEQEIARIKAEAEEQVRQATQAKANAEAALAAKTKADASAARSMIATVLFFDVVGYTKQSVSKQIELKAQFNKLVSEFIKDIEESQRIILDTGDGAAIGFLQHPEDAIEVAQKFRHAVTANKHQDYPDLKVRIGIHLGPVNIVKDMNGQSNMVGDGINDAQRIMSFASSDHIYISRSYFDVVSRLSAEYAKLFQYRGVKNDKHGRQHQVYEASVDTTEDTRQPEDIQPSEGQPESVPFSIQLEPFVLNDFGQTTTEDSTQLPNGHAPSPLSNSPPEGERDSVSLPEFHVHIASEKIPDQAGQAAAVQEQGKVVPQEKIAPEKTTQKMQQEIEAQALAKQNARREAVRIEAEQEAIKAKIDKDERQMADEQAKAWAEAEQRVKLQATTQAKAGHTTQQPVKTPPAKASRVRRKPLPLGKIAASLFFLLLVLVAVLPYVWPMQDYVAQLEKKLSAQLQQPVHITHMKAALLPLPKLELQDVSVGGAQELKATSVVFNFDVTTLFAETKAIKIMEVNDLALDADTFGQALSWLQAAGGNAHYPVARMTLQRAHISSGELSLPSVNGNVDWDAQGHFSKALLHSEDGKLDVELQPQQSHLQIALLIKESRLPWFPGILFNELNAKGETSKGAADFTEVDGHLYGGKLAGSAHLNWQKGWQMQGHLSIRAMELQEALPQFGIEGEMDGDSNFLLNSVTLPQLSNAPHLNGTFTVKKGVISKMDMVETAANHHVTSGGRTHFDELSGTLQVENNSQHLRQIRISSGAMSANGSLDVSSGGQLSGQLSVDLKMRPGNAPLALSGTLADPILRLAH
jgi:hypothetical protein